MTASSVWLRASYVYATLAAALLGYFLLRVPVQVMDCFFNILALDRPFLDLMRDAFGERGYLRPGLWAALKGVHDLSGGDYFMWYRGTHVLQVALLIWLFVRLLQPRTPAAATVVPLAIAVLIGSQTFAETVLEAFPINTFLTIVICCAAAANLAFARHRWWNDVLAALLFAAAALTVESGLLVWVIIAAGYLVGLRGVSRTGVLVLSGLLAVYFWARFGWLGAGLPTWSDREAGFGFARRGGAELEAMFGDSPLRFYVYNVASSIMNVLVAEPRDGVWRLTQSFLAGEPNYVLLMQAVSTVLATVVIGRFVWKRRRAWLARRFARGDQMVLVSFAVLVANATFCYAYTKDVIMSPAGLFFAAAVFVACTDLVETMTVAGRGAVTGVAIVLLVLSATWAVRAVGVHVGLSGVAVERRDQWAYVEEYLARRNRTLTSRELPVKLRLQDDAVRRFPLKPALQNDVMRFFGYCCP